MITNIIQLLHTTTAYQTAAFQLMVGEANFAAKQLDLKERLPITITQSSNEWNISPPPWGVGGSVLTSNYVYRFEKGRLTSIKQRDWEERISPATTNLLEWTRQTSLIDSNGAYQLATQWLGSLSVDVAKLEQKDPAHVFQRSVPISTTSQNGEEIKEQRPVPFFEVGWSKQPPPFSYLSGSIGVKILGTTQELLQLRIRDVSFFRNPPLQVTNASELLGPLPPPRHFVEQLVGGKDAYETIAKPDRVEAWLLDARETDRIGPVTLKPTTTEQFSNSLLDFNSYAWTAENLCSREHSVRLKFTRGNDTVEFRLGFECDYLQVTHHGQTKEENFAFAHNKLVKAIQSVFPRDEAVKKLELENEKENRKEFEEMLRSIEN